MSGIGTLEKLTDGFQFDATCPQCGASLARVADGRPYPTEVQNLVRCSECPYRARLLVRLVAEPSGWVGKKS